MTANENTVTTGRIEPAGGIALLVREARQGAGLTQGELAALVGVTAHTVGSWEAGRRSPRQERLGEIAFHCNAARAARQARADATREESRSPARVTMSREERMSALVGAIFDYWSERGYPPTLRELQDETGFSSLSVVEYWLDECEEAGLLRRPRNVARAVTLTAAGRAFAEARPEAVEAARKPRGDGLQARPALR